MHGTFAIPRREQASFVADLPSLCVCLAFAAMPFALATVVALIEFGRGLSVDNLLDVLRVALNSAPL